jgi:hypothetical protein
LIPEYVSHLTLSARPHAGKSRQWSVLILALGCPKISLLGPLSVSPTTPKNIYLLSALDSNPRDPIIRKEGIYNLYYSVVAEGFPLLNFVVKIIHKGGFNTIKASLK